MKLLNLNDHKANISTLLTFPRCASRQGDEGVDEVGAAAARWENGADREKGRVERWERESEEQGWRGCRCLEGWGGGPEVRETAACAVCVVGPQGMTE